MVQKLKPANSRAVLVGLTGTFGSGKSTAAGFFKALGARVIDADRLAHEALKPESGVYDAVRRGFTEALEADKKTLSRRKLAAIVFSDGARRKKLEALIHPYVFGRMKEEIGQAASGIIILEVPLLFETGLDTACDCTIVVTAPEKAIYRRLESKGIGKREAEARIRLQWPIEKKEKQATHIIHNDKSLNETKRECEKLWKKIQPALKGDV